MTGPSSSVDPGALCQSCGACCAYSADWPRFTLESEADLDRIPTALVNDAQSGMRWKAGRCSALSGMVGAATSCGVYAIRPIVCRACMPGDPECDLARARHGMAPVPPLVSGHVIC